MGQLLFCLLLSEWKDAPTTTLLLHQAALEGARCMNTSMQVCGFTHTLTSSRREGAGAILRSQCLLGNKSSKGWIVKEAVETPSTLSVALLSTLASDALPPLWQKVSAQTSNVVNGGA